MNGAGLPEVTVDARGVLCPVPIIRLARAAAARPAGTVLELLTDDPAAVRELMTTPIAGDITAGEPHDGYLLFQGGVPEMRDLLSKIWS